MPILAEGQDDCLGPNREDISHPNALNFWVMAINCAKARHSTASKNAEL